MSTFCYSVLGHKIGVLRSSALFQEKDLQGRVLEPITSAYADIHDSLVAYYVT